MTILDQIIKTKEIEINYSKGNTSIVDLVRFLYCFIWNNRGSN